jgi:hypothetical protein
VKYGVKERKSGSGQSNMDRRRKELLSGS